MNEAISKAVNYAVELCKGFEGFSPTSYRCPAGRWTIGYGTVYKPDGTQVTEFEESITKELAEQWLVNTIEKVFLTGILRASPSVVNKPLILGALIDFAYNLGVSRYRASTLRKRINTNDLEGAVIEIKKWRKAGGRILPGLVRRRAAEAEMIEAYVS